MRSLEADRLFGEPASRINTNIKCDSYRFNNFAWISQNKVDSSCSCLTFLLSASPQHGTIDCVDSGWTGIAILCEIFTLCCALKPPAFLAPSASFLRLLCKIISNAISWKSLSHAPPSLTVSANLSNPVINLLWGNRVQKEERNEGGRRGWELLVEF